MKSAATSPFVSASAEPITTTPIPIRAPRAAATCWLLVLGLLWFPLSAQAQKGETWSPSAAVLSVEPAADYAGGVRVDCGTQTDLTVTLQNTGTVTWDGRVELGATGDSDPFRTDAAPRVALPNWVAPGDTVEVTVPLTIAADLQMSGTTEWQLVASDTWFGDIASRKLFVVCQRDETDDAIVVSHTLPELMECGSTRRVGITMENTGTSFWSKDLAMRLGDPGNADPFGLVTRVHMPDNVEIAPGQQHTFEFDIQAPQAAGTYTTDWRMVHTWVRWFGETVAQQINVTCDDYGVRFLQPREEVLDNGQVFDWGVLREGDSPMPFTFRVAAPDSFAGSMYDLRVVSQEGPVKVSFGAPVSELTASYEVPAQEGLDIAGTLGVQQKMLQEVAPGAQVPFRAVLAFDHNLGGTFQFEIAGSVQKAGCSVNENWSFRWADYSSPFFELIPREELPQQLSYRGEITNNDTTQCLSIPQTGINLNVLSTPLGISSDTEAFGIFPVELQPGETYAFNVLINVGVLAESGEYSVNVGIAPNSSVTDTFNISGEFEILEPGLSLDNVSVYFPSSGDFTGNFGVVSLAQPVEESIDVSFEIENRNESDMRVEALSATIIGPAAAGLSYFPSPASAGVLARSSSLFGGQLQVLSNAVPGEFTIRVSFRVTDDAFPPNFDEQFLFDIEGTLVACGGAGNCGPVAAVEDPRGDSVHGTHRLSLGNEGTHDLGFSIFNIGDEELTLNPTLGLSGDGRFSIAEQLSPTTLPAGSDEPSSFLLRFDAEGTSIGQVFAADVLIAGAGVNLPYTFRLEVEMVRPIPLIIEVVGFVVADGQANLGTHDQLPLLPKIVITNPTEQDYYINNFKSQPSRGGPLKWTWTSPVPLGTESITAKKVPKDGGIYEAGGEIDLDDAPGDVNKPYTFDFSFDYGTRSHTTTRTYRLDIVGDLVRIYNSSVPAPEIDCDTPANHCVSNFCARGEEIFADQPAGAAACVGGRIASYWLCLACAGTGNVPCWGACIGANLLATGACALIGDQFVDDLAQLVYDTRACYCDSFNEFCEEFYFVGYEVRNQPVATAVDIHARCTTSLGLDIDESQTVTLINPIHHTLLSCPKGADVQLWMDPVQAVGGGGYRCTLVNPGPGDDAAVPRYNRVLDTHFSGVFDCSCTDPAGCGQLYSLLGTAQDLQPGDAITVVANLQTDSPVQVAATVTVTENGQFQFPIPVPVADSYVLTIENKDDYPHCTVESTGNAIGGPGNAVDIARLSCDATRPNVTILVPGDGETVQPTSNGTIQVTAVAGDASGIRQVIFYEDGTTIGVSTSSTHLYELAWVPNGSGQRTLQALAENLNGVTAFSELITVNVTGSVLCDGDTQAPVIQRVYPAAGEAAPQGLGTSLTLEAEVTDDTGMSHVDFYLDGDRITLFNSGPLFLVNVPQVALGQHTLRVVAVDVCGKQRQIAQYSFTVVESDPTLASGSLTIADCSAIFGYAQDVNHPGPIFVELYRGGPRGVGDLLAQLYADDSCSGLPGSATTCFSIPTPQVLMSGMAEAIYAHARDVDTDGQGTGLWPQLLQSPRTITCGDPGGGGGDPPPIPNVFSASSGTYSDRVQLNWSPADGAENYQVYRNNTNQSGAATMIAGSVATATYDDMNVQAGTTYYYWLKASNDNGSSGFSPVASGYASVVTVNDHQPDGFVDVADCTNIAGWARDADTTGPIQVHLYRGGPAGGGGTLLAQVVADDFRGDLPFTDKNHGFGWNVPTGSIPDGMPIYAYGINVDSSGNQAGGSSLLGGSSYSFDCPVDLAAPTGVAATDGTYPDKVRVTWNAVSGATSYNVWRAEVGSGVAVLLQLGVTAQVFDDTSAVPGLVYDYWVAAHNSTGTSAFSTADTGYVTGPATNTYQPEGSLEIADCTRITGWTRDGDFSGAIEAHIYRDAPAGQGGTIVGHALADIYRSDLPYIDKSHGYDWQVPAGVTIPHGTPIYVYGIGVDSNGNETASSTLLFGSPMSYNCPANGPPVNNYQPEGTLDTATCTRITGWARDADNTGPIQVHLYKGAPAGSGGQIVTALLATQTRTDLPFADQDHGFDWPVPAGSIPAGTPIYAYAINVDSHGNGGGDNPQLVLSPRVLTCP